MDKIENAINTQLSAAQVLECNVVRSPLARGVGGQFNHQEWLIDLNERTLCSPLINSAEASALAETVFHEAKHGEQFFKIARLLAGQGESAEAINARTGINLRAATEAMASPITSGTPEAERPQAFFDSIFDAHRDKRDAIYMRLDYWESRITQVNELWHIAASPEEKAQLLLDLQEAKNERRLAETDYKSLPEEVEAWLAGSNVGKIYLGRT